MWWPRGEAEGRTDSIIRSRVASPAEDGFSDDVGQGGGCSSGGCRRWPVVTAAGAPPWVEERQESQGQGGPHRAFRPDSAATTTVPEAGPVTLGERERRFEAASASVASLRGRSESATAIADAAVQVREEGLAGANVPPTPWRELCPYRTSIGDAEFTEEPGFHVFLDA